MSSCAADVPSGAHLHKGTLRGNSTTSATRRETCADNPCPSFYPRCVPTQPNYFNGGAAYTCVSTASSKKDSLSPCDPNPCPVALPSCTRSGTASNPYAYRCGAPKLKRSGFLEHDAYRRADSSGGTMSAGLIVPVRDACTSQPCPLAFPSCKPADSRGNECDPEKETLGRNGTGPIVATSLCDSYVCGNEAGIYFSPGVQETEEVTVWYPARNFSSSSTPTSPPTIALFSSLLPPKQVQIAYYQPPYPLTSPSSSPKNDNTEEGGTGVCTLPNEQLDSCAKCTDANPLDIPTCLAQPSTPLAPEVCASRPGAQKCEIGCVCKPGYLRISTSMGSPCVQASDCASGYSKRTCSELGLNPLNYGSPMVCGASKVVNDPNR